MRVSAFIQPCLPSRAERPPCGPGWVHEIKHDGFRLMVRRDSAGIRLITRNGHDWSDRFPLIRISAAALRDGGVRQAGSYRPQNLTPVKRVTPDCWEHSLSSAFAKSWPGGRTAGIGGQ